MVESDSNFQQGFSNGRVPTPNPCAGDTSTIAKGNTMNNIVWIVGAIVIILAVLSFVGLR
jgi:hypothetical protein